MDLSKKIDMAINFIKEKTDRALIGYSGGKDSIVVDHLSRMSGIETLTVYSKTGIDLPEVVKFILSQKHVKIVKPGKSFWHAVTTQNPPLIHARWCCTYLKKAPIDRIKGYPVRIMGIRSEESSKREKYGMVNFFEKRKQTHLYPIYNWNEADVWGYIDSFKLQYPSVYDNGIHRVGCVVCPYQSKAETEYYKSI